MVKSMHLTTYRLIVLAFSLVFLAGCSSANRSADAQSYELSEIPIPPSMTVYEGPEESTLDALILASQQAFEDQPKKLETQYYWVVETMKWEQIEQFYETAFANSDWKAEGATFNTVRWVRNDNAGKQVLVISAVPLTASEGHILVLLLVSD